MQGTAGRVRSGLGSRTASRPGFPLWRRPPSASLRRLLSAVLSGHPLGPDLGKPVTFDLGNYEYYSGYAAVHGYRGPAALPGPLGDLPRCPAERHLLPAHLAPVAAQGSRARSPVLQSLPVSCWRSSSGGAPRSRPARSFCRGLRRPRRRRRAPSTPRSFGIELGETSSDVLLALLLFVAAALLYRDPDRAGHEPAPRSADAGLAGLLLGVAASSSSPRRPSGWHPSAGFAVALLLARVPGRMDLPSLPGTGGGGARCRRSWSPVALYLPMALMLSHRYRRPALPVLQRPLPLALPAARETSASATPPRRPPQPVAPLHPAPHRRPQRPATASIGSPVEVAGVLLRARDRRRACSSST